MLLQNGSDKEMRSTKIVCTLGPACAEQSILEEMLHAGMNVARMNFSHGDHAMHRKNLETFRRARENVGVAAAVLLDTRGPEIRTLPGLGDKGVEVHVGEEIVFAPENDPTRPEVIGVTYPRLSRHVQPGDRILIDDGKIRLRATESDGRYVHAVAETGGVIRSYKGINLPGVPIDLPFLSEKDQDDLRFGVEHHVDYVAASFTRTARDIRELRRFLEEAGGGEIRIIAKIENQEGINNFDEILAVSDGIMIARGDMGVEIPYEELPQIQKMLITKCRLSGKRCITATEMLESMINQPRPTRAEISDVANAVYDGTSAIMLSGETAGGKYPVQAVEAMARIALETEAHLENKYGDKQLVISSPIDALSHSACVLAEDIGAKAIVVCSRTGGTARLVSRFRPKMDIVGMTLEPQSYRKLALSWGVIPVLAEEFTSMDVLFYHAKRAAVSLGLVNKGDRIVITGGNPNGKSGNSNVINIEQI